MSASWLVQYNSEVRGAMQCQSMHGNRGQQLAGRATGKGTAVLQPTAFGAIHLISSSSCILLFFLLRCCFCSSSGVAGFFPLVCGIAGCCCGGGRDWVSRLCSSSRSACSFLPSTCGWGPPDCCWTEEGAVESELPVSGPGLPEERSSGWSCMEGACCC